MAESSVATKLHVTLDEKKDEGDEEEWKESKDDMFNRHVQERKELTSKFERNKSSIPRKDRASRARLAEDYANEVKQLQERQERDRQNLGYSNEKTEQTKAQAPALSNVLNGLSLKSNDANESASAPKESRAARRRRRRAEQEEASARRVDEERARMGPGDREVELEALKSQLLGQNLGIHQIQADGHCLYNAVAHQMKLSGQNFDVDASAVGLRAATADYMMSNSTEFEPFIDGIDDDTGKFAAYCEELRNTAVWGGQVELRALAELLGAIIEVYAVDMPVLKMGNSNVRKNCPVFKVSYHRKYFGLGEHYNSIIKR